MKSDKTKLKDKAWSLTSLYVRRLYSDKNGYARCYTCHKKDHYKNLQAGHFVPSRRISILFDLRGLRVQCIGCNVFQYGRPLEFMQEMEKEIGIDEARELRDELMRLRNAPKKMSESDYQDLILELNDLLTGLDIRDSHI